MGCLPFPHFVRLWYRVLLPRSYLPTESQSVDKILLWVLFFNKLFIILHFITNVN
jgi:hypothetical protein